ncbi:MAG TPA: hypothetical protein VFW25_10450 [Silvibacterium sp.]|nr:hypothetical protein [Silvibacterium sp.]
MKIVPRCVAIAMVSLVVTAFSHAQSPGEKDTLAAAKLSPTELHQILDAVEQSAYDTPDSWDDELRAKRVDLGESPGIVLQGRKLLCGATGNCQLFVFRKVNDKWVSLFAGSEVPVVEGFRFGPGVTHGIKDLTVSSNSSAESSERITYKFDGQLYRAGASVKVIGQNGMSSSVISVDCTRSSAGAGLRWS